MLVGFTGAAVGRLVSRDGGVSGMLARLVAPPPQDSVRCVKYHTAVAIDTAV